jgi:HEAT repeat protein
MLAEQEGVVNGLSIFRTAWACVLISMIPWPHARADSWGPPKKEHWSANETWVLKVGWPDDKTLSLWEKTEDGLRQHWRRGYVDQTYPPHRAYLTDDGKYVVLRDMYHSLGYGKVIVILRTDGQVLGSYALHELLPQDEIREFIHTVSSIWWSGDVWFSFINENRQFAFVTPSGTLRCFDLSTGKLLDLGKNEWAETVDLMRKKANAWVESESPYDRIRGISLLAELGVVEAIPKARKLFRDKECTNVTWGNGPPVFDICGVQEAAARALVQRIGVQAIPLIEEELPMANSSMKRRLMGVLTRLDTKGYEIIKTPDSVVAMEMWRRLANHASVDIRYPALCQVLRRDDGTYLSDHPELIESESESVRWAAVNLLARVESPAASTLLRKAITDEQDRIRHRALRYLVDREPADIETLLLPYLQDDSASIRSYVICELACRGNPAATERLTEAIAVWPLADLDESERFSRRREIEMFCRLIADLKLRGVKDMLVDIRSMTAVPIATWVTGALAAQGDQDALRDLHRLAGEGKGTDRAIGIEMCRYLTDERSAALVKQAAASDEPRLCAAATKSLLRFKDRRE